MKKFSSKMLAAMAAIALFSTISTNNSNALEPIKAAPVKAEQAPAKAAASDVLYVDYGKYKGQPASNKSREGAKYFKQNNCANCHSIEGKGGCLAPPLDGIGGRRSKVFVESR
ncbi:MAG: hypothetical protein C0508_30035, partial [Cyanobacteria bacterium PR.023]|nr:hypothetical protein [Cyanobacteria bacterium PR.023]